MNAVGFVLTTRNAPISHTMAIDAVSSDQEISRKVILMVPSVALFQVAAISLFVKELCFRSLHNLLDCYDVQSTKIMNGRTGQKKTESGKLTQILH